MPRGYARYVLGVMVGINFLNYLDRYILPSVATRIQSEFHLTDSQVGLLGSAFLLVYAVATIPVGISADPALLGDYFQKEGRGRAMSIWAAGTAVGIAVGFAGGGIVASTLGWRAAFYMTALPGLIFAILAFRPREPLRGAAEAKGPQTQKAPSITWRTFLQLLQIPTLRSTIAAETALFFVLGGAAFWLPTYLSRRFGLGTGTAGTLAGAVLVALALLMPSLLLFVPMFLLGAACLYLYNGPYTAIKQNVVLPTVRASAVTLALLIEHLLGDSYAPFAIGKLSDALGTASSLPCSS